MDDRSLEVLWVYLSGSPLLSLMLTLVVYLFASALFERGRRHPLLNPVLWSILLLSACLWLAELPYDRYFEGAQFIHFLLGPATIALAVPLAREFDALRRRAVRIGLALAAGLVATTGSTLLLVHLTGLDRSTGLSIAPKSTTAPVAMGIADTIGGAPSLTAVFSVLTGVFGAVVAIPVLKALRIRDDSAKGFAIGLVAHGIGTARALQIGKRAGAYAGLSMALMAIVSAMLLPYVMAWFS